MRGVHDVSSKNIQCRVKELTDLKGALSALDDLVSESSDDLLEHASVLLEALSSDDIHECRDLFCDIYMNLVKFLSGKTVYVR